MAVEDKLYVKRSSSWLLGVAGLLTLASLVRL